MQHQELEKHTKRLIVLLLGFALLTVTTAQEADAWNGSNWRENFFNGFKRSQISRPTNMKPVTGKLSETQYCDEQCGVKRANVQSRRKPAEHLHLDLFGVIKQLAQEMLADSKNRQEDLSSRDLAVEAKLATARQMKLDVPFAAIERILASARSHTQAFKKALDAGMFQLAQKEFELAREDYATANGMAMPLPLAEARCIWLDRGTIVATKNDAGMEALFDRLKETGFNTVYFETNNAGYAMYNASLDPVTHKPKVPKNPLIAPNYDPLGAAVVAAHKRSMSLHAWMWTFAVGSRGHNRINPNTSDDYPGPVLEKDQSLGLHSDRGSPNPPGQPEFWLSPANKRACMLRIDEMVDVATLYQVDGIQLDYIRFPWQLSGTEMGFDAISRTAFEQENPGYKLPSRSDQLDRETREVWHTWKATKVTNFVRDASRTLRKLRPGMTISAAVYATPLRARIAAIQQHWEVWANEGLIDVINPMTYAPDTKDFSDACAFVRDSVKDFCLVYPGTSIDRYPAALLIDHIEAANKLGFLGTTLFAVAHLQDSKERIIKTGPNRQSTSQLSLIVPHEKPVTAAKSVYEDFAVRAIECTDSGCTQVLATTHESSTVVAQIKEIQRDLKQLTEGSSQASLEAVLDKVSQLENSAKQWLRSEPLVKRTGRSEFLLGKLNNVRWLLTYSVQLAKRTHDPSLGTRE
jgi:uncharacterized lipoprotein YddW (UPF0748 family)